MWIDTSSSSLAVKSPQLWHGSAAGGGDCLQTRLVTSPQNEISLTVFFLKQNLASFADTRLAQQIPSFDTGSRNSN